MFRGFKFPFEDRFGTTASAITFLTSTLGGIQWLLSHETVQKKYIKHKLLTIKFPEPTHLKKCYIARPNDLDWLIKTLPKRLDDTSGCLYMIGNPRGYGKSALVKEMAYKRDDICKMNNNPSGPVLFTDIAGFKDLAGAEKKILETIRPLFIPILEFKNEQDELSHKLRLVKEVALELSKAEDEKVVMWVFDSFNGLVSSANKALSDNNSLLSTGYGSVITTIFGLNDSMIPVAVCSSATTAGALNEISPHVWVRTRPWFPPIVEDREKLKEYAKNLYSKSKSSVAISEDEFDDIVSSFGGCLLMYEELLSANKDVHSQLQIKKSNYTESLKSALDLNDGQMFTVTSLNRFKLLQAVARGEKIVLVRTPEAKFLLSKHGEVDPFLGVHPEGHLFLSVPMTKQSLKEVEPLVAKKGSFFSWWK